MAIRVPSGQLITFTGETLKSPSKNVCHLKTFTILVKNPCIDWETCSQMADIKDRNVLFWVKIPLYSNIFTSLKRSVLNEDKE